MIQKGEALSLLSYSYKGYFVQAILFGLEIIPFETSSFVRGLDRIIAA